MLGQFINQEVDNQSQSPNYLYILFESAALSLTYCREDQQAFGFLEEQLTDALNKIIQNNLSDLIGYAFQLYATFVANSPYASEGGEMKQNYSALAQSLLQQDLANWSKEMKYAIPAFTLYLQTIMAKYQDFAKQHGPQITAIIEHLLGAGMRCEP